MNEEKKRKHNSFVLEQWYALRHMTFNKLLKEIKRSDAPKEVGPCYR